MSGNSRIISGKVAHSKKRGRAFVDELGSAFKDEQNAGASNPSKNYGKKH